MERARERDYYTVSEAASRLGVSRATIWRWINAGRLPAYRMGPKTIRIRKSDLDAVPTPIGARGVSRIEESEDIWAGYDPEKAREILKDTAGSWADVDAEALIADIYRWREEGSRPPNRP